VRARPRQNVLRAKAAEGVLRQSIVAVDEGEELAGRGGDARVAGVAEAMVGLADEPDPVVAVGETPRDQWAGVGRAVVHDHHLEIVDALVEHRIQAVGEVFLDVVRRDDHADSCHPRG